MVVFRGEGGALMDTQTHRLERLIRERCYDLRAGSELAHETRESLMAELTAIRPFVPRDESHRLEVLIERLTGVRT